MHPRPDSAFCQLVRGLLLPKLRGPHVLYLDNTAPLNYHGPRRPPQVQKIHQKREDLLKLIKPGLVYLLHHKHHHLHHPMEDKCSGRRLSLLPKTPVRRSFTVRLGHFRHLVSVHATQRAIEYGSRIHSLAKGSEPDLVT